MQTPARPTIRLEVIDIATPCPADFAAMTPVDGDRVRQCRHCRLDVYDLSAMTRGAAEQLVAERLGAGDGRLCVRMTRRADGTVVTADCRGRWRASAARWAARWGGPVGAAVSVLLAFLGTDATGGPPPRATMGTPPPMTLMGGGAAPVVQPATRPATQPAATQPTSRPAQFLGRMAVPMSPQPPTP